MCNCISVVLMTMLYVVCDKHVLVGVSVPSDKQAWMCFLVMHHTIPLQYNITAVVYNCLVRNILFRVNCRPAIRAVAPLRRSNSGHYPATSGFFDHDPWPVDPWSVDWFWSPSIIIVFELIDISESLTLIHAEWNSTVSWEGIGYIVLILSTHASF